MSIMRDSELRTEANDLGWRATVAAGHQREQRNVESQRAPIRADPDSSPHAIRER